LELAKVKKMQDEADSKLEEERKKSEEMLA
jgi:hypothetical protein